MLNSVATSNKTPIPWLLYALAVCQNAALNFVNESFDPTIKSLFIRFKPSTDMVLYVISIVGAMFFGAMIFFYAPLPLPLPWPNFLAFLLITTAITARALTWVKHMTGGALKRQQKDIYDFSDVRRYLLVNHSNPFYGSIEVLLYTMQQLHFLKSLKWPSTSVGSL